MTKVIFKGEEVEVIDKELKVGDKFPNFRATNKDLTDFSLEDVKGKTLVINTFPSVDTGICALQTIRFNNEVKNYKDLVVITVSKDLPFALNRFCGEKGIENAITVSDFKYRDFENVVGGHIPEVGLLARQVIVLDKEGTIKHLELIKETSSEPDYNAALEIVKEII
ncbi:thiol peroxidase [Gemelliphila palaticanis]|uniref:Thiol peroxidase n=1 Tax=Gemelliphila palaticanis TaxID=81950 RepID=A0ABX2SZU8_9BACL|nr:thiol peroxidase [Gemella palaticanis]MBF0714734.1 thiol peroxidase [Gemella palaticanis]NYS46664.1 thiol peroxidase [Gemella palaticanis]